MRLFFGSKWARVCLLVVLFGISTTTTLILIHKWRRTQGAQSAPPPHAQGGLENIPGLHKGDVVKLPTLANLQAGDDHVDLSTVQRNYILCAFISTECAGCSQDEPFWKALRQELNDKNVAFYIVAVDTERTKVQNFANAYEFADLPVLFDPQRQALEAFKISFVPQYVLITSDGHVMDRWNGIQRFDPKRSNAIDKLQGLLQHVSRRPSEVN
jgi:peroxiredoxin